MTTQPKIFKKTLHELGANLPMGFPNSSGDYVRTLSTKPWTMKAEKELGKMRDKIKKANVAKYTTTVLAEMFTTMGPHNFAEKDPLEKQIIISQMMTGDVFYAYVWLRKEVMGHELPMKITCSKCEEEFDFAADLNSLNVKCVSDLADLDIEYQLKSPIEIRGKVVRKLLLKPIKWSTFEMMSNAAISNPGLAKEGIILGSVGKCDAIDGPIVLVEGELDELTKQDVESLVKLISDNTVGPEMSIEGIHEKCGGEFEQAIEWGYDDFFGGSSQ